eukprot:14174666-Alexandrium_andersonii.AAC.1
MSTKTCWTAGAAVEGAATAGSAGAGAARASAAGTTGADAARPPAAMDAETAAGAEAGTAGPLATADGGGPNVTRR